jgi:PKD repeat protein
VRAAILALVALALAPVALAADAPVAHAGAPFTAKVGDTVQLDGSASTASAGATIVAYAWDFGDGTSGQGPRPTHAWATGGVFHVTLSVVDSAGRAAADALDATILGGSGGPAIAHTPVTSAPAGAAIVVRSRAAQAATFQLHYGNGSSFRTVSVPGSHGWYNATIPGSAVVRGLAYYLTATDAQGAVARLPATAGGLFRVNVTALAPTPPTAPAASTPASSAPPPSTPRASPAPPPTAASPAGQPAKTPAPALVAALGALVAVALARHRR